jgi:hypothetical protein
MSFWLVQNLFLLLKKDSRQAGMTLGEVGVQCPLLLFLCHIAIDAIIDTIKKHTAIQGISKAALFTGITVPPTTTAPLQSMSVPSIFPSQSLSFPSLQVFSGVSVGVPG